MTATQQSVPFAVQVLQHAFGQNHTPDAKGKIAIHVPRSAYYQFQQLWYKLGGETPNKLFGYEFKPAKKRDALQVPLLVVYDKRKPEKPAPPPTETKKPKKPIFAIRGSRCERDEWLEREYNEYHEL
jgi:hypothetical protein